MKRVRYSRLMAGLSSHVARSAMEAADMAELDEPDSEADVKSVTKACDEIRERLLWIERAAHNIQ